MPFFYRDETQDLNEFARKEASGSFLQLSDGFTHYQLSNPDAQETVVLVHGFSVPYFIFDPTFEFLTQSGLRVLRYDLFGRGYSDRPEAQYNIDLFVRQLRELLEGVGARRPVHLVGLSTGGPISAVFTERYPERVHKLVLIDPVGAKPFALGRALKLMAMPLVGETIISLLGIGGMTRISSSEAGIRLHADQILPGYITQMRYKGFKRAILSTIRNDMLGSFIDTYEHIGKMNKPVLLFWGPQDHTVPFQHSEVLCKLMPNLQFCAIEDAGHIPHYEKPAEVNPILLEFLRAER
jgi:pimeloyl-ACP methyl ester carboxylesterase